MVSQYEISQSYLGDHLQISWIFSAMFVNMSVGAMQNFS